MSDTSKSKATKSKKATAKAPLTDEVLIRRSKSSNFMTRDRLAKLPNLPIEAQRNLATDIWEGTRASLAGSPTTHIDVLRQLASDRYVEVRLGVATNLSTPADVVEVLLNDRSARVTRAARVHPNLPKQAKDKAPTKQTPAEQKVAAIVAAKNAKELEPFLFADNVRTKAMAMLRSFELGLMSTDEIRKNLKGGQGTMATNKWLELRSTEYPVPTNALLDLAIGVNADAFICTQLNTGIKFEDEDILRLAQAHSLKTTAWYIASSLRPLTIELLTALSDAPSHSIARWDLGGGDWTMDNPEPGVFLSGEYESYHPQVIVALHSDTPSEIVEKLRKARSKYVRAAILSRPETTEAHLIKAAKDKDGTVRAAVAKHPQTSAELLHVLAVDEDAEVRAKVVENPKASPEIRALAKLAGT